jgi:hypothetical protein
MSALLLAVVAGPVSAGSADTVTVTPSHPNGWACANDQTDTPEPCTFVTGPATPPLGVGSAQLSAPTPADGHIVATPAYAGTPLANVNGLDYWTFQPGPTLAIALQFDIRYRSTDTAYGGRLVFEPYQNGAVTVGSGWRHWDASSGLWWASKTSPAGSNGLCPQSNPCPLSTILSAYPNATLSQNLVLKAGSGWTGFTGNADALTVSTTGGSTTYDFEPDVGPPTNKDQCKNGGWQSFTTPTFKNQGDCVSYVATNGKNPPAGK